jgi:hypothetical protein
MRQTERRHDFIQNVETFLKSIVDMIENTHPSDIDLKLTPDTAVWIVSRDRQKTFVNTKLDFSDKEGRPPNPEEQKILEKLDKVSYSYFMINDELKYGYICGRSNNDFTIILVSIL